ncbi:type II toxin-antitoxin system RelE/ParE family toxin [Lysobacter sp. K5869]|uniref:type II toxin-antitoxin system RelE/ParE family toxin n=1 Tax=Lysobacter sp. K5869 TaxID=2820808 RepID=UPI001C062B4F|nr:type II toxin-antitoxin system RelE/ParE family toxin [Lysobacter sp. K5869]QWP78656.1 type II toxin-antitoxin system RelE/ParE family toxin [Lysobacter sp. K5869]
MTRIVLAPAVAEDFARILDHLDRHDAAGREQRIDGILHAVDVLADNPLIGRPAEAQLRELVVGRDASGYVALYRYLSEFDTVLILAIRAQREAGYAPP